MPATRKLTVVSTTVVKTGTGSNGKPWTLYDVTAVGEDGAPIEEKLRSFDELEGTVEVLIERKEDAKYGVSYTLKLPRGSEGANPPSSGARLGPKVDELRARVDALEKQLAEHAAVLTTVVERLNYGTADEPLPAPKPQPKPAATF
jgi:hypothetical protein